MAGRRGQKRRNEGKEKVEEEEERRTAMRYLLVRHIRDQPTGTLMLAIVISPFLLEGTFIFGTRYEFLCSVSAVYSRVQYAIFSYLHRLI